MPKKINIRNYNKCTIDDISSYSYKYGSILSKYKINKLIYFEEFGDIRDTIDREKQIKAGSRAKKKALINDMNPEWRDLFDPL